MLGAIIGDIVGSVYEFNNIKTKDFPLFHRDAFFTDDTVMTIAIAEGIMNGGKEDDFIDAMKKYGKLYPNSGYGAKFNRWINSSDRAPYGSFGNGAAMRISPCAEVVNFNNSNKDDLLENDWVGLAQKATMVTHNHPEGIKGAMAVCSAIILAKSILVDIAN